MGGLAGPWSRSGEFPDLSRDKVKSSPEHIHAHSDRLPFGCLLYMYRLDLTPVDNPQVPVGKFSTHIVTEPYLQVLTRRANIGRLEPPLKREVVS